MLYYERKFKKKGCRAIAGIDEAGRGPLAGPVVAAAVVLRDTRFKNRIDDSKKLTPSQREKAFLEIGEKADFGVGIMNERVIELLNIREATKAAMECALEDLARKLDAKALKRLHVLVDGNTRIESAWPCTFIINGDAKSKTIASASIVAKVIRDRIMGIYDKAFPQYGFRRHKGYGTKSHQSALRKFGPCVIHRTGFLKCLDTISV